MDPVTRMFRVLGFRALGSLWDVCRVLSECWYGQTSRRICECITAVLSELVVFRFVWVLCWFIKPENRYRSLGRLIGGLRSSGCCGGAGELWFRRCVRVSIPAL